MLERALPSAERGPVEAWRWVDFIRGFQKIGRRPSGVEGAGLWSGVTYFQDGTEGGGCEEFEMVKS